MKKTKKLSENDLEQIGGLIIIKGTNRCLGDLIHLGKLGTFCPYNGGVPVSEENAAIHNEVLDQAKMKHLDKDCPVGQSVCFYWNGKTVTTFLGTQVNTKPVAISGTIRKTVYFLRNEMQFKGVLQKNADCFWARRQK